jgi:hypothetical protein
MPEKEKDETTAAQPPPVPKNRMVAKKSTKVRVIGKQPIAEEGKVYHPKRKGAEGEIPADTFMTTEERAEALSGHVEVVED